MNFNKRGIFFEYVDLIFTILIALLLIVFIVFFSVAASNVEHDTRYSQSSRDGDVIGSLPWATQHLAQTYTKLPVGDQTLGEALADNASMSEVETALIQALNNTDIYGHLITVGIVREGDTITCRGSYSSSSRYGFCQYFSSYEQNADFGVEQIRQRLHAQGFDFAYTFTPGKTTTMIGVIVRPGEES